MKSLIKGSTAVVLLAFASVTSAIAADTFPTKPIHIIVAAAAGGGLDITSRLVAQKMQEFLGQPVVVENRAGADTLLGTRYVKDQPADGYTVLAQSNGFSVLPTLKLAPGFDPLKDFTGIGLMTLAPMVTEVGKDQPEKSLADIIAQAKANPGKMTYGTGGSSTPQQLSAAAFQLKAGISMTQVMYKGAGPTLVDVAGGRISMTNDVYVSSAPYIKAGTTRVIATTGEHRMAPLPDVPTYKEQGIDLVFYNWLGLLVPAGTPKAVVKRLSDALHYATTNKELAERFRGDGSEPGTESPEDYNKFLRNDVAEGAKMAAALHFEKQ